jgi:hypothetical protein
MRKQHLPLVGPEGLAQLRLLYRKSVEAALASQPAAPKNLRGKPRDLVFAAVVREGPNRWLAGWVKRSSKPEYFAMIPGNDRKRAAHWSYHRDGSLWTGSWKFRTKIGSRQPLSGLFRGTEMMAGDVVTLRAIRAVGAVYDPEEFDDVLMIPARKLASTRRQYLLAVNLVEPGRHPRRPSAKSRVVARRTFKETAPWIVITLWESPIPRPPKRRASRVIS